MSTRRRRRSGQNDAAGDAEVVRTKREAAEKAAAEKKRMALQGKSMIHIQTPERPAAWKCRGASCEIFQGDGPPHLGGGHERDIYIYISFFLFAFG